MMNYYRHMKVKHSQLLGKCEEISKNFFKQFNHKWLAPSADNLKEVLYSTSNTLICMHFYTCNNLIKV